MVAMLERVSRCMHPAMHKIASRMVRDRKVNSRKTECESRHPSHEQHSESRTHKLRTPSPQPQPPPPHPSIPQTIFSMALTITLVSEETGEITTTQIQQTDKVQSLHQKIHTDLRIPPPQQDLQHNGSPLDPHKTVSASGLSDGDLIMVHRLPTNNTPPPPPVNQDPASLVPNPAAMLSALRADPALMSRLHTTNPTLHSRIIAGDPNALNEVIAMMTAAQSIDPMSADAQKQIEERIRQENVERNLHAAMEHNPESFGAVVMLFVDGKINKQPIKAFVDSGAQTTIIAKECAERCNILRLMDARFTGVARGVGTAKIHGRIHLALLTMGDEVFEVSLTVMDAIGGEYDMLLGLDMLRKHQASIDLQSNCLRIGHSAVPFLAEKDIPLKMRGQHDPTDANPPPGPSSGSSSGGGMSTPQAGAVNPSLDNEAVKRLQELGFARDDVIQALQACQGNADQAAAMLAANKYGF